MKRILLTLGPALALIFMVSFKQSSSIEISVNSQEPGEKLIAKSDCIGCHHKTNKLIGPAYVDIAKKYPLTNKNVDYLAGKIIKGGTGVWGKIPMTPHATLKKDEAKEMARYILSLK
jgi:cytochrome c